MRLFSILCTLAAVVGTAIADANPILTPAYGQNILAGQPLSITWTPTSPGPITLTLRFGATNTLSSGTEIASGIKNSGSFTWTVPTDFGSGWYTVQIEDTSNGDTNYSPTFSISGGTGLQGVTLSTPGVTASSTSGSSPSGTSAAFTTGTTKSDATALTSWSASNCGWLAAFGAGIMAMA